MTVPEAEGIYVTGDSFVNLSHGLVRCAIKTPYPLPARAWRHVAVLAGDVETAAHAIALTLTDPLDDEVDESRGGAEQLDKGEAAS